MLNIENLHYAYRGRPVLNGVNLHIERGTLLTLLGRNGAGKSTLLNCIAGLLKPQQGQVLLNGQNVQAMRPRQIARLVGYVSHRPRRKPTATACWIMWCWGAPPAWVWPPSRKTKTTPPPCRLWKR